MNIIIHFRHFPVAMGRWFDWALRDLGHNVWSVGCYNGGKIPWDGDFDFTEYDFPPDHEIPEIEEYPIEKVLEACPFKPDLVIQAGDTTWLTGDPGCPNVILATDPHVINYYDRLEHATHLACMQHYHLQDYPLFENKFWLPYGCKEDLHVDKGLRPEYDVVFIGLQYQHRQRVLDAMEASGLKVFNKLGMLYDEFVDTYNKGRIAFNYSSKNDLPARFWEGMAMGRVVLTNYVPDLKEIDEQFGIWEGACYMAYKDPAEAVRLAKMIASDKFMQRTIGSQAKEHMKEHTYKHRAKFLLEKCLN